MFAASSTLQEVVKSLAFNAARTLWITLPESLEDGDGLIDVVLKLDLRRDGAGNEWESTHQHSQRSLHT